MDSPFVYSKWVTGKDFIGRKQDCAILGSFLRQGEHVALYSTPKCGKTSLIQQTLFNLRMTGTAFTVGQLSLLNVRTREDFLTRLGSTAIRCVASSPEEYESLVTTFLSGTHLVFDRQVFSREDKILSPGWSLDDSDVQAILRLPQRLAEHFGQNLILILDEFSNIDMIEDGEKIIGLFEEMLRERKKGCTWIFCGSAYNAMREIFDVRKDFYRVVERFHMQPIDQKEIVDHIVKGFLSSGKVIDRNLLAGACNLFKGHMWYINHLVSICDSMSKGYIMEPVLIDALGCMIAIHEPRFIATMDSLTTHQVSLLKAVVDGYTKFSTAEVVSKYGLNSSANVKRVKDALVKKEVLTFDENEQPEILDPLFEDWVRKYYFEKNDE